LAALSGTAHSVVERWTSDTVFDQLKDALLAATTGMVYFQSTGLLSCDSHEPPLSRNIAQTGEGEGNRQH
jgi:hypothetical protein